MVTMPNAASAASQGVGAAGPLHAQATTQDGTQSWDIPLTTKFLKRQRSYARQFYYAETRPDGSLRLGNFAPWQDWC